MLKVQLEYIWECDRSKRSEEEAKQHHRTPGVDDGVGDGVVLPGNMQVGQRQVLVQLELSNDHVPPTEWGQKILCNDDYDKDRMVNSAYWS